MKGEPEHIEVGQTQNHVAKPTFGQRVKRHCARRWWIHLLIFCVIFLIIALCLVYVGMPKIAQHGVDESSLQFTALDFLFPTPSTIVLSQASILHSPSIYTPTLDAFNASLYLVTNGTIASDPMMHIPMPSIHALHPQSSISLSNQNLSITNLDQLTDYATAVLSNEYVTTTLTGRTGLHEGKLPVVTVDYNSSSTYRGLNGLAGFNVTNVKINLTAPAGSPNLAGYAYIPNPSVMTIAMGNVTLSLSTAAAGVVGNATIPDMTLVPGNNTLPMTGIINQILVTASLDKAGMVDMQITGQSAVYNGEHLTYYEKALASNKLSLAMNVVQILADST